MDTTCTAVRLVALELLWIVVRSSGIASRVVFTPRCGNNLPRLQKVRLSLLAAESSRVFILSSPRGHNPPPPPAITPPPQPRYHRFLVTRHDVKRPDVALHAIDPLLLVATFTTSSLYRTLKSLMSRTQFALETSPVAHSDERPRPRESSRAHDCLDAPTSSYPESAVAGNGPVVWCLLRCAPRRREARTLLAKGPRTASIPLQEGLDCRGLCCPGLEGERCIWLVV